MLINATYSFILELVRNQTVFNLYGWQNLQSTTVNVFLYSNGSMPSSFIFLYFYKIVQFLNKF